MIARRHFVTLGLGALTLPMIELHAADAAKPLLRFLFFTDAHAMLDHEAPRKLRELALRMRDVDCDLILGGGDFVDGGYTSTAAEMEPRFAVLRDFLGTLGRPVQAVIGNHDLVGVRPADGSKPEPNPSRFFCETFGLTETHRFFDHAGYRFIILNSIQPQDDASYRGWIDEAQMAWLKNLLAQTPLDRQLVLCSHIPFRSLLFQSTSSPMAAMPPNLIVGNANEVLALFANHQLPLVLQGHLHINEALRWNERLFLTGGAVSGAWWKGDHHGTQPGFGTLNLSPQDSEWNYQGRRLDP